ncbi:YadA-like family protein [Advenella mimigardefordensis]|uniref:YadA domain-containing protein n=1 Tax=Advenella mimigardefordensis (strain DSM 17166 / LMG 22922 / DPN7) TaxID=1247726 RepID=W0PDA9_ADVMD|nr:YadA-like family protein [Advenella mimigardefordensis]AHG63452.1 YadA domain-containing protein [Advenella mimigardefordensis DPN7]
MCRLKRTIPQVTFVTLACMLLFCRQAGAEQGEPLSTQLGHEAEASGTGAVAIGWGAHALGKDSIAIGSKTQIIGPGTTFATNGGIAIGTGSQSRSAGDVNFGSRKLSGLRDATSDDEAVTMRQMKAAKAYTETVKSDLLRAIDSAGAPVLSEARAYSDLSKTQAIAAANTYSNTTKNEAIAAANAYSDAAMNDTLERGKHYAEQIIAASRAQYDTSLLSQARSYSDRESRKTLENAHLYSEEVGRSVLSSANAFTEMRSRQARDSAVDLSRQYTDRRVNQLQSQIKKFRRRANAGISGAMAMTTLTPPPANANTSFGMALATYRNQMALASGVSFRTGKNSNFRLNTSWDSAGGIGAAAGFNMAW